MNRSKLLLSLLFALMLAMMVSTGPVGAQDTTPVAQSSVEAPSATPEAEVESAEQAEILTVNGVTVLTTDPDIDESHWWQCGQTTGLQLLCQGRVDKKLYRLGFDAVDWSDPDGAIAYMSTLFYENKPDKRVISHCTSAMAAKWEESDCWVHPATPTPPPATSTPTQTPTNTPEPSPTATSTILPTATGTQVPTATSTSLPTATATSLPTNTPIPTNTAFPTATATVPPTPTPGIPWRGHTLTLGSFCAPGAEDFIGQAPGAPLSAYIGAYTGTTNATSGDWWGGDNASNGWTQTTTLSYGQAPRVWSYATSATTPLVGWYFVDPATGLVAERAQEPEVGFRMGGDRDSKWLASLHDCQPVVLAEQPTGTPPPAPAGQQAATLRQNGGGDDQGGFPWFLLGLVGFSVALKIWWITVQISNHRAKARKEENSPQ